MRRAMVETCAAEKSPGEVQCAVAVDAVVAEGARVLQLLAGEGQALLLRRSAVLAQDLGLDGGDGVGWLHVERDGPAADGADEDLKEEKLCVD